MDDSTWVGSLTRTGEAARLRRKFSCVMPSMGTASTSLTLDGEPWWPVGLNAYQLGTDWRVNAGCGAQVDLDGYFARLPPHTLTRFNAYSSLAVDEDTGELDFGPLDAVFEAAERHGPRRV